MTDKVLSRGILNHFNPLVTRFCACRLLPAVLLAVLLPIFTVRNLGPCVAREALDAGWPVDTATRGVMLASAATGVVIGLMLENATFDWVFILTYLPIRIIAPGVTGPFPTAPLRAFVAYWVWQAKECHRTILLPQRAR